MLKISKIALLLLQSTFLVFTISYSVTISYHTDRFLSTIPLYLLVLVILVAGFVFGIKAIKQPLNRAANQGFLVISLIPNLFLAWLLFKYLQNYHSYPPNLLPYVLGLFIVPLTFIVNLIFFAQQRRQMV